MTPFHYLALGDSYTIGECVAENESFPVQTVKLLRGSGLQVDYPEIIATTGWTTDELEQGIKAAGISRTFDMVTLLIGVNNQYRGRSAQEYAGEFTALLKKAIAFAGNDSSHVVVLSIPDWSVTPFAADREGDVIATAIDAFNAVNREIAQSMAVHYLDITHYTRQAAVDKELVASDGLHPSGKDYARWAQDLAPIFLQTLQ
ncbi:MAG TPA: SGNH/GDSL hydrolase family protein [Chitinophaga sp.]|uniref:SGNH/GDSL hydrolase family protein n=1 Tax=Chitinophaga sp. TaxID=1869181 RepID=UPI002CA3E319|nr:SGNH/GDSL hydrolase family protein [Chitinophaga sp.]HVI45663.1 SGNH/GDSL hydrolase family protein [Chitinophaga sp.]